MVKLVSKEDLVNKISNVCPDMLTHTAFMHVAELILCKGVPNDGQKLSSEELDNWLKLSEEMQTTNVDDLVKFLKDNFNPQDKLCITDCVPGLKYCCVHISKDELGKKFFRYVKTLNSNKESQYNLHEEFPYVNENDVVIS